VNETIIIVHGTWAAPVNGVTQWWQPATTKGELAGSFVEKLNTALEQRGASARCWAHCDRQEQAFEWSGDNNWLRRTEAAVKLVDYLGHLRTLGYRYHLIGHSHGGNVIAEALSNAAEHGAHLGTVITIATPFIETQSQILQRRGRNQRLILLGSDLAMLALFIVFIVGIASVLQGIASISNEMREIVLFVSVVLIALFVLLVLGIRLWRRLRRKRKLTVPLQDHATIPKLVRTSGGLAITSRMDEVWQILHHLRIAGDPIAVQKSVLADVWDGIRTTYQQRKLIVRLHGAKTLFEVPRKQKLAIGFAYVCIIATPFFADLVLVIRSFFAEPVEGDVAAVSVVLAACVVFLAMAATKTLGTTFYSAFLAPVRSLGHAMTGLMSVPQTIITRIARNRLWSMLQKSAMGLNGYAFDLPHIEVAPPVDCAVHFTIEQLSEHVVNRAVEQRGDWVHKKLGGVTASFSAAVLTPAAIENLLKDLSEDLTLVHASYYTDDQCINRMADWISGAVT
jgi:hypothetical protein